MIPVIDVFHALYNDNELNGLMDEIRGTSLDTQTIFQLAIPEDFQKKEKAPLIRIESINNYGAFYCDDIRNSEIAFVQVSTMTPLLKDLAQLICIIDRVMKEAGYEQYSDQLYREPDLGFMYSARSYSCQKFDIEGD
ncbi:hypothetical protein EP04_01965 [Listeria monocytogenes]|nr:hypothetical protein [Listeria monocytogenes]